jgi:hypothetical protein
MKIRAMKTIVLFAVAIAGAGLGLPAQALQVPGRLGVSPYAVDVYSFACATGTTKARIRVFDTKTVANLAATVFATFGEDGIPTLQVSDTESIDTSSAWASNVADGPGNYALTIAKSASNPEDYVVEVQCLDSRARVIGPIRVNTRINM